MDRGYYTGRITKNPGLKQVGGVRQTYVWKGCRYVGLPQHAARAQPGGFPDGPEDAPPMDYPEGEPEF